MNTMFEFETWGAFVDAAENGPTDMPMDRRASRESDGQGSYGHSWHGASWVEALKLARIGWPEGANKVKAKLELMQAHLPSRSIRNEMKMQMVGPGTLDMQRYQQGHPEPWVTWQPQEYETDSEGQIVTVLFNISASSGVSVSAMFDKGAVICALVDLLERVGKRVELILADGGKSWDTTVGLKVIVKKANEPLDLDRIAFALAHASCLRRLGFSIWEQAPADTRRAIGIDKDRGYGAPANVTQDGAINILASSLYDESYSEAKQFQWLKTQLATQGVDLKAE